VGSPNDMDVKSVGSNGGACFGGGRCESGVGWWASHAETALNRAR